MNFKTLLYLILCLFFSTSVLAQEEVTSNNYILGGSLNFSMNNSERSNIRLLEDGQMLTLNPNEEKSTYFSFNPYLGKVINEHWLIGVQLGGFIGKRSRETNLVNSQDATPIFYTTNSITNYSGLEAGIFTRYVLNPSNKINFYLQPNISFYNRFEKQETIATDLSPNPDGSFTSYTTRILQIQLATGVLYNVNDKWRIVSRAGLASYRLINYKSEDSENTSTTNNFGINLNLSTIYLGLEYTF